MIFGDGTDGETPILESFTFCHKKSPRRGGLMFRVTRGRGLVNPSLPVGDVHSGGDNGYTEKQRDIVAHFLASLFIRYAVKPSA